MTNCTASLTQVHVPLNVLFCQGLSGGELQLTSLHGHMLALLANKARSPSTCTSSPSTSQFQAADSATFTWIWWAPFPAVGAAHTSSPSLTAPRGGQMQCCWPRRWQRIVHVPSSVGGLHILEYLLPSLPTGEYSLLPLCGQLSASCWTTSMCRPLPTFQRGTGWWSGSTAASRTPSVPAKLALTG